jgi:hypothetical protein
MDNSDTLAVRFHFGGSFQSIDGLILYVGTETQRRREAGEEPKGNKGRNPGCIKGKKGRNPGWYKPSRREAATPAVWGQLLKAFTHVRL